MKRLFLLLLLAGLALCTLPAGAALPGGGISVIFQCPDTLTSIACTANDAAVSVNGISRGTISSGVLEVPYEDSFSSYTISKNGYYDKSGSIPEPAPGQTTDITIDATLTQKPAGTNKGWFKVQCNVDGAAVSFDGDTKGVISGGSFTFDVATTATPFTTYSVSKSGYVTSSGTVSRMPSDGETITLTATLNPVPTTTVPTPVPTAIGGDMGWYKIVCNADGASVYLDSTYKGVTAGGQLSVPVYSTGTPFKTYRVEKSGYITATGSLPAAPAKGQTVPVSVILSPAGTSTPTLQPTTPISPPGSEHGWIAIHTNVDGATVTVGSNTLGTTKNGVLTVSVATTGTPYSSFTVSKPGYTPATGTVPRQPGAGETVDLYVTLSPSAPTPAPTTQSPLSLPLVIAGLLGTILLFGIPRR